MMPIFKSLEISLSLCRSNLLILILEEILGIISLADTLRPEAKRVIKSLQQMGLRVYMLTGDNQATAGAIASELGLDDFWAEVLPQEKNHKIEELRHHGLRVAMVGDGVNDAPALAVADWE
jgi:P-type E1-E2 ATPase